MEGGIKIGVLEKLVGDPMLLNIIFKADKNKNKLWLKLCQAHVQFRLNSDIVRGED